MCLKLIYQHKPRLTVGPMSRARVIFAAARQFLRSSRTGYYCVALLLYYSVSAVYIYGGFLSTFIGFASAFIGTVTFGFFVLVSALINHSPATRNRAESIVLLLMFIPLYVVGRLFIVSHTSADLGFDLHRIATTAMYPTLLQGDYVLTDTWAYRRNTPAVGDVVQLRCGTVDCIRRVVSVSETRVTISPDDLHQPPGARRVQLQTVEVPLSTVQGKLSYVVWSSDSKRIGLQIVCWP
jgi:hypothetical protein